MKPQHNKLRSGSGFYASKIQLLLTPGELCLISRENAVIFKLLPYIATISIQHLNLLANLFCGRICVRIRRGVYGAEHVADATALHLDRVT